MSDTAKSAALVTINAAAPKSIIVKLGKEELDADQREFSSGSMGYYAGGKVTIDNQRYQVTCSIVLIGSKPGKPAK